jgi:hypothetical protein
LIQEEEARLKTARVKREEDMANGFDQLINPTEERKND